MSSNQRQLPDGRVELVDTGSIESSLLDSPPAPQTNEFGLSAAFGRWTATGGVMPMPTPFGKCTICGKVILHGGVYYLCSVSTCNKKRLPMLFCSWDCWDAHLPDARHRDASCIEEHAPRA